MRILAIETSCDETDVAVLEGAKLGDAFLFTVLGSSLKSQAKDHAAFGGVYPNLAKREHEKNLPVMLEAALKAAGMEAPANIDAIAVTQGPGLEPALWTGITFAENLAKEWKLPLIPVNHMEGHLLSSLVQDGMLSGVNLPVLGLLISGGHTEFVVMKEWFRYEKIGETLDDAVGECFDKVARMLGLEYPGGPHISRLADKARADNLTSKVELPRPMLARENCDVSFSGLKTAALYALRDMGGIESLTENDKAAFAREFEDAVGDVFVGKTRRALEECGASTFVIGGGVAANRYIRERLQKLIADEFAHVEFRLPDLAITGDNAIMIAEAALARALSGLDDTAKGDLKAFSNRFSISSPK